jgi:hypothetical protein
VPRLGILLAIVKILRGAKRDVFCRLTRPAAKLFVQASAKGGTMPKDFTDGLPPSCCPIAIRTPVLEVLLS